MSVIALSLRDRGVAALGTVVVPRLAAPGQIDRHAVRFQGVRHAAFHRLGQEVVVEVERGEVGERLALEQRGSAFVAQRAVRQIECAELRDDRCRPDRRRDLVLYLAVAQAQVAQPGKRVPASSGARSGTTTSPPYEETPSQRSRCSSEGSSLSSTPRSASAGSPRSR